MASRLDAVIAASGVSKATFYANFADRAALVEALIRTESDRIVPEHGAFADGGDLIEDLTAFGVRLMNLLTHADMMSFERLIITASRVHADAPRRFFDAGPGRSRQALAKRLALAVDHGELVIDDPVLAAEDLVGLWQGMMRVELAVGLRPHTDAGHDARPGGSRRSPVHEALRRQRDRTELEGRGFHRQNPLLTYKVVC